MPTGALRVRLLSLMLVEAFKKNVPKALPPL